MYKRIVLLVAIAFLLFGCSQESSGVDFATFTSTYKGVGRTSTDLRSSEHAVPYYCVEDEATLFEIENRLEERVKVRWEVSFEDDCDGAMVLEVVE